MPNHIVDPAGADGDHRKAGGHGFQDDHALGFGFGGEQEGVAQVVPQGHFIGGHRAYQCEVLLQAQGFDFLLQSVPLVAVTDHQEPEGHVGLLAQGVDGLDHEVDVFFVGQARDADEDFLVGDFEFLS